MDRSGPGVLVLRLSRDFERELAAVEQLAWLHPDASLVLIADNEQRGLSSLAWDLGVKYVLLPPHTRERVEEIVFSLMRRFQSGSTTNGGGK
jgi:hypothetical protein